MRKGGRQRRPRGLLSWWKVGKVGSGPICSQVRSLAWAGDPQILAWGQKKILWRTCLKAGQGQRGRNLVMSRNLRVSNQDVPPIPGWSNPWICTLDLGNSESGTSWDRARRHHSFTGTHWCEPQWSCAWGTFQDQNGLSRAACSNASSCSLISCVFNLFCQKNLLDQFCVCRHSWGGGREGSGLKDAWLPELGTAQILGEMF